MSVDLHLTPEELRDVTGYAQRAKQKAALAAMCIPFRENGIGRILVLRSDYVGRRAKPSPTPDFGAISKRKRVA
jgi:hypothetical protein